MAVLVSGCACLRVTPSRHKQAASLGSNQSGMVIPAFDPYVDNPLFQESIPDYGFNEENDGANESRLISALPKWMPDHGPHFTLNWTNRLLVWPERKFAFCWIDKNAGTEFNILMNHLTGKINPDHHPWRRSSVAQLDIDFKDITTENGWKTAIFVRRPEERLVSAWLSKCVDWEDGGKNCLGGPVAKSESVAGFEAMVRTKLLKYMNISRELGSYNTHYDPQATFCGGRPLDTYDFVGYLTGDTEYVHQQVRAMLKYVAEVPKDNSAWTVLPKVFPQEKRQGHHDNAWKKLADYYQSRHVYATVLQAYEEDYDRLGFDKSYQG